MGQGYVAKVSFNIERFSRVIHRFLTHPNAVHPIVAYLPDGKKSMVAEASGQGN
jgi:hypothetical protein